MKQKVNQSGFTLAEIAIVLAIIGIAMTMGLKMLTATLENGAISDTQAKQERIRLALVSFMRTNGRLPCPDNAALPAAPTGVAVAVCTTAALATNPAAGSGRVPWVTLGLTRDAALDGWGNYFTYRVANFVVGVDPVLAAPAGPAQRHLFANHNWTTNAATPSTFDIRSLTPATAAVAGFETFLVNTRLTPDAALTPVVQNAVAVILSHGRNGLGARTTRLVAPAPLLGAAVALDESTNGAAGAKIFVQRAPSDVAIGPANPGGPIDDIVTFLTPQDLLQPLVDDKTLDNNAASTTQTNQERIKLALISYLRSNGRLPCPDTAFITPSYVLPTGVEPATCTTLGSGFGVIPWISLGLPRDAVLDGWGNFFTYRVANFEPPGNPLTTVNTGALAPPLHRNNNQNWTIKTGGTAFDIVSLSSAITLPAYQTILIQNRDPGPGFGTLPESRNAVAVIISHGKNGLGARSTRIADPMPMPDATTQSDELINATRSPPAVAAPPAPTPPYVIRYIKRAVNFANYHATNNPGGPYDDVVSYITPQDLLQPLISEKTLFACSFYCAASPPCTAASVPIGNATPSCP
jgi:prepilin-type N-terminal cleavage/methylation domain-containing protein